MKISKRWRTILEELDQVAEKADDAIEEDKKEDEEGSDDSEDKSSDDSDSDSDSSSEDSGDTDIGDIDISMSDEDLDDSSSDSDSDDSSSEDSSSEEPEEDSDSDEYGVSDSDAVDDTGVMDELKKIYTPILIMQNFETKESCDRMKESFSQANVLTEQNVIKFDNETRVAQLLSVCALLLARKKNSEKWQAFKKAAALQRKMKIEIQKEEAAAAKALARKFLDETASGDNEDAKSSAAKLLPEIDEAKE